MNHSDAPESGSEGTAIKLVCFFTPGSVSWTLTWGRTGYQGQHPKGRGGQECGGHDRGGHARGGRQSSSRTSGPFCLGCYYLSQQLGTTIHFRHPRGDCPRNAVTVKMFEMKTTSMLKMTLWMTISALVRFQSPPEISKSDTISSFQILTAPYNLKQ